MSEQQSSTSEQPSSSGRFIRAALVIFPLGTILLGIASFGIWQWKKDRVEDRNLRHASALRQEPSAAGWNRYHNVLAAVSSAAPADRLASTASYLESSLGAEGMGYAPLRFITALDDSQPVAGVTAELTGNKRPHELVLVLIAYGDSAKVERENAALASLLTLANWLTGEPVLRTLRFAALPVAGMDEAERRQVMERFGEEMRRRDERVLHLVNLSPEETPLAEQAREAFQMAASGAVLMRESWPATVEQGYDRLREKLLELARRP